MTETVAQTCSILCIANHNFTISTSECVRYPPKCALSSVNNEKFSGEAPQTPPSSAPSAFRFSHLRCSICSPQTSEQNENWYPPLFGTKLRPCFCINSILFIYTPGSRYSIWVTTDSTEEHSVQQVPDSGTACPATRRRLSDC